MPNSRKQVAFDLDTDALKIYMPGNGTKWLCVATRERL